MNQNEEPVPPPVALESAPGNRLHDGESPGRVRPARPSLALMIVPWLLFILILSVQVASVWLGIRQARNSEQMAGAMATYQSELTRLEKEKAATTNEAVALVAAAKNLTDAASAYTPDAVSKAKLEKDYEQLNKKHSELNDQAVSKQKEMDKLKSDLATATQKIKDSGTGGKPGSAAVSEEQIDTLIRDWRTKHDEIDDRLKRLGNSLDGLTTNYATFRRALADGGDQHPHGAYVVVFHRGGQRAESPAPTPLLGIGAIKTFCERQPLNLPFPKFRLGVAVMSGKTAKPYLKFESHPAGEIGDLGGTFDYQGNPDQSDDFNAAGDHIRTALGAAAGPAVSTAVILVVSEDSVPPANDDRWKSIGEKARIHVFMVIGRATDDAKVSERSRLPDWVEFSRRYRGSLTCLSATRNPNKEWQLDDAQVSEAILRTARPSILPIAKEF